MTKKLSEYEKMEKRHKKATANIVEYLRKIIKDVSPYHTTDILIEDLEKVCEKIEQLQAKNEKLALYTSHNPDCEIETDGGGSKCTCGLEQALTRASTLRSKASSLPPSVAKLLRRTGRSTTAEQALRRTGRQTATNRQEGGE